MHIQTIKQNMHTIFLKSTVIFKNLSMKFKTKLKYESNFSIGFSRKTVPVTQGYISTALLSIPKQHDSHVSLP